MTDKTGREAEHVEKSPAGVVDPKDAAAPAEHPAPAGARAGAGLGITLGVAFPDGSTKQYTSRITVGKEPSLSTSRPAPGAPMSRANAKVEITAPAAAMDTPKLPANCGSTGAMSP